jgi:hypothetical protein
VTSALMGKCRLLTHYLTLSTMTFAVVYSARDVAPWKRKRQVVGCVSA